LVGRRPWAALDSRGFFSYVVDPGTHELLEVAEVHATVLESPATWAIASPGSS
jgi:hypothetical protein